MQVRELNRKIFHNSSRLTTADHLNIVNHCYQLSGSDPSKMQTCMKKWN